MPVSNVFPGLTEYPSSFSLACSTNCGLCHDINHIHRDERAPQSRAERGALQGVVEDHGGLAHQRRAQEQPGRQQHGHNCVVEFRGHQPEFYAGKRRGASVVIQLLVSMWL